MTDTENLPPCKLCGTKPEESMGECWHPESYESKVYEHMVCPLRKAYMFTPAQWTELMSRPTLAEMERAAWKPVSVIPTKEGPYLVFFQDGTQDVSWHPGPNGCPFAHVKVTHWRELPAGPEIQKEVKT